MATIKVEKNSNYTVMSNIHFREKEMSLKAKGLLSLMLSLPNNWDYSIAGLVAICKENETAIKSTLQELKKFGYLEIRKMYGNETGTGRIAYEYIVYEVPHNRQAIEKQEVEKQGVENQPLEILQVENQGQLNTNILNTKELNTKEYKERKKEGTSPAKNSYNEIIANYTSNTEVKDTILEFLKMRKLIKKPMTDKALKLLLNKLDKLSNNADAKKIAILEQSIENSWQSIYELKEAPKNNNYNNKKATNTVTVDKDRLERIRKAEELGLFYDNVM